VGHHGSRTSTTPRFLEAASPRWATVSTGEGNRYGHPDDGVLARLRETGARVLRTDLTGAVVLVPEGDGCRVSGHPPRRRWNRTRETGAIP